jgi:hypothetical protein
MAASLKLFPGSTVRWCGRRYMILDYAGLDAIIGREPGKRRPERIPVNEAAPDHASHPNLISQPDQALRCGFPFAGLGKWPTTGRCQPTEKIRSDVASMLTRPRYADRFVITGRRFCQTEPIQT